MTLRQRHSYGQHITPAERNDGFDVYNIIPIHNILEEHPSLRFPEVRAAMAALFNLGELRKPPFYSWNDSKDLLDWLGAFFGFQEGNVKNQREHLVLLLANGQMRLHPPPLDVDTLDHGVVRGLRRKILGNYISWCSYLGRRSCVDSRGSQGQLKDLLYSSLYLLIWGEAANLRFLPECLCYIFHHMGMELNLILEDYYDPNTGRLAIPATFERGYLTEVVTPIYLLVKAEVEASRNGTAPHSAWRNYDDINEFFWSSRCFRELKWPPKSAKFFASPKSKNRVGKTGFVEQRSFWNIFRSFDRLWVMLILFFQAAMLVAWAGHEYPWQSLQSRDLQIRLLSVFITWASLRFLQSILDAGTQYSLVSRETVRLGVRMVLKCFAAVTWAIAFGVLYSRIWDQRYRDRRWSTAANARVNNFLVAAAVFIFPEFLAVVLFVLPGVRNFIEKTNWRILYVLTWWFHTRTFVGRGLREGVVDNFKYALFWISILCAKFTFSYFLQIKPLVAPTKVILQINDIDYKWHEFFGHTNRFAVVLYWLPVVLIYSMDIQIWYSIISAFSGALIGLFSHLGEIRNLQQLRLRFQFFASALQFNLMSEEQHLRPQDTIRAKLREAILRLQLRYGLGRPYKKIESNQVQATRFALIWNEIIEAFREEDIVSDKEVELLELSPNAWRISVIRWPCFLLCNQLLLALRQATELDGGDKVLWRKISKNEYRRCAVIESYDSVKFLLLKILRKGTEEHHIMSNLLLSFDGAIVSGKFTDEFQMRVLEILHYFLMTLVNLLIQPKKNMDKIIDALQSIYEVAHRDFPKSTKTVDEMKHLGWVPVNPKTVDLLFEKAVDLPDSRDVDFYKQVRRLHTILTSRDSMNDVPRNLEARRRIAFFTNSLFMNMPRAPKVEKMLPFSVLTPYYSEEVLYGREQLQKENEDGISILFYLQKIYDDEWENFIERMRREGMTDDGQIWEGKLRNLRLWASYRGQTLSRTVRGMMYYYRALKMLAFIDSASEMDVQGENGDSSRRSLNSLATFKGQEYGTALMKFTYVIACQIYGSQKKKKDSRAEEILYLMKENESLRVAYVDEVSHERGEVDYYSVLVKYDQRLEKEVEIYRVKLPGPLKLGEGKPENQNHAIIFTRGDAVQTIDMNQDNYFEETLKMRNLLEEYSQYYGARKPTILGVRENVFTGSVSSLAWFMSAQETSFVTLVQRVLANPLKVRMHYGHPDVFDRLWFLSRGGISKASRVINISEDIFAGFNCTLRGGNVTHHEYIQVGKGRDVGLNQISMFEAKVASGNGEQSLSRDLYRLGHRLDFFRMLSVFYSTVGFYFNTMVVILTVYSFVWGRLYLALSGLEDAFMNSGTSNNRALGSVLNQQFVIQLGLFTALPMIVENSLEHGFLSAIWDFITMQIQLASVFYTFSMGTRTHYFGRTILHGGAKYRATGRGFVVQHKSFAENYRLYSRSHFVKAIELGLMLTVYAAHSPMAKSTLVYILLTISTWFLVISWVIAPFVFNPSGFDWLKFVEDFDDFMGWIWYKGGVFTKAEQSWETWWYEEQDHLRTTGLWGKLLEIILDLRYFIFQYGIVYQLKIASGSTSIIVYLLSWIFIVVAVGMFVLMAYINDKYAAKEHLYYRAVQSLVTIMVVLVLVLLLKFTDFRIIDIFTALLAFLPTGWGLLQIAQVARPFVQSTVVWDTVVYFARLYEISFGITVLAPVALLSWLPGFQHMQTRVLFNEAFSRGLQISQIVTGKKSEV